MRIIYGVHGYSRGHATRASAVLSELTKRHEVQIWAGADAYDLMSPQFDVVRIPSLGFSYGPRGHISLPRTARDYAPLVWDLLTVGRRSQALEARARDFAPDVIVSDAEPWTHRLGPRIGVPRVGFDHFGIMVHCAVRLPWLDRLKSTLDRATYSLLMGRPQRILVSSFFEAEPLSHDTRVIGPLLRPEVLEVSRSAGEHLLVYLNKGAHQLTPGLLAALKGAGLPIRLYGAGREGEEDNIQYRAPSNRGFLEDLASARAVVSTAGNQLVGEALHYGKPMLVMPENCVEQRMNAAAVARLGVGEVHRLEKLTSSVLTGFTRRIPVYRRAAERRAVDGREQALELLERWFEELATREGAVPVAPALAA